MRYVILIGIVIHLFGCATSKVRVLPYKDSKLRADEWVLIDVKF